MGYLNNTNASFLVLNARKSLAAGAPPQTPLGELTALPQTPYLLEVRGGEEKGGEGEGWGGEGKLDPPLNKISVTALEAVTFKIDKALDWVSNINQIFKLKRNLNISFDKTKLERKYARSKKE